MPRPVRPTCQGSVSECRACQSCERSADRTLCPPRAQRSVSSSRSSNLDLRRMNPPLRHAENRHCLALATQRHLFKHWRMLQAPGTARDQHPRVVRPGRAARETSSATVQQCRIPIVLGREKMPEALRLGLSAKTAFVSHLGHIHWTADRARG